MTVTDQPALPLQFNDDALLALLCDTRRELAAVKKRLRPRHRRPRQALSDRPAGRETVQRPRWRRSVVLCPPAAGRHVWRGRSSKHSPHSSKLQQTRLDHATTPANSSKLQRMVTATIVATHTCPLTSMV
jgi:hypothetical protein